MCIDYKTLNKQTKIDTCPLPHKYAILYSLNKSKILNNIDVTKAYHQMGIYPKHEEITAFLTWHGLLKFLMLPFGLVNAPSIFQRVLNTMFSEELDIFCTAYLDNILIYRASKAQHESNLCWTLNRLWRDKLFANRTKCEFGNDGVEYLGLLIKNGKVSVDPA